MNQEKEAGRTVLPAFFLIYMGPMTIKHFQEKWEPVFRPKMRQTKSLQQFPDSINRGTAVRAFKIALFTALTLPGFALADEAHERDHAMVRQRNQRELEHVRRRDTAEAARGTTNTAELADYARRRAQYERDLAAWRRATGQR